MHHLHRPIKAVVSLLIREHMWFAIVIIFAVSIWYFFFKSSSAAVGDLKRTFHSSKPYSAKYLAKGSRTRVPMPKRAEASGKSQGMPECKFLLSAKQQLQRDYVLVIDRSGSMSACWADAAAACKHLAPYICKFDPDGISIILFDHEVVTIPNVKSPADVAELFNKYQPRGSTDLALALHAAFEEHFGGSRGASTILVVTDGAPDSQPEVERIIRRAANSIEELDELSISFVQIGDAPEATKFLVHLDDTLSDVKFDVVDTITADECKRVSFAELIARSIYD